jgi:hypothetical protein
MGLRFDQTGSENPIAHKAEFFRPSPPTWSSLQRLLEPTATPAPEKTSHMAKAFAAQGANNMSVMGTMFAGGSIREANSAPATIMPSRMAMAPSLFVLAVEVGLASTRSFTTVGISRSPGLELRARVRQKLADALDAGAAPGDSLDVGATWRLDCGAL